MEMQKETVESLVNLGRKERELSPKCVKDAIKEATAALIPEGMKLIDLSEMTPPVPRRKQENLFLTSVDSFILYVNEQKNEFSRVFGQITKDPYTFTAVIDYHGTSGHAANWCEHKAVLTLGLSQQFKTWRGIDGKFMTQSDFVEFLKDNRLDIVSPDAGQILQLCMELEATSENRCIGKVPTNKGVVFSYSEDVTASRGGEKVTVPDSIRLQLPVFDGMDAIPIDCDFKFRVSGGMMNFGIRMLGVDLMLRDAVKKARAQIEEAVNVPVLV